MSRTMNKLIALTAVAAMAIAGHSARSQEPPTLTINAGGHTASVTSLVVLPDGQLLSGSFDNTLRLWDLKSGNTLRVIRGQMGQGRRGQINALAMTPDNRTLVVGGWFDEAEQGNHRLRVYDWPQGTVRTLLSGHAKPVRTLAMSRDGQLLASGDYGGSLRLWRKTPAGFDLVTSVQAHTDRLSNAAFDPTGGNLLITTGYDGVARYWQASATGLQPVNTFRPLTVGLVYGMSFRNDGQLIAFSGAPDLFDPNGNNGEVRFFDRTGKAVGQPIVIKETGITSVCFSPDGKKLALGCGYPGTDTRAAIFSHPEGKQLVTFDGHDNTVNHMRFLADGQTVVSLGGYDNAVRRWDVQTGKPLPKLGGQSQFLWNVATSASGKTIYWGSSVSDAKGRFGIEKYNNRGPLEWGLSLEGEPELVQYAGEQVNRGTIAFGSQSLELRANDKLQFVQLAGGNTPMSSGRDRDVIFGATFLPFSKTERLGAQTPVLVAGGESVGLFDAATGRRIHEMFGHIGQVLAVAPSPLGDFAVTAGGDQTCRLWHLPSGQLRLSIFHAGNDWVAWTPKGFYACSPQGDRMIGWQVNKGEGQDPESFSASQFSQSLFKPDVVKRVFEAQLAEPGAGVDKIGDIAPPEVQVIEPAVLIPGSTAVVSASSIEVKALAKSVGKHPVTELRLLLDGRPYEGKLGVQQIEKPRRGAVAGSWTVELTPGDHRLAVQAKTEVSTAVSDAVLISVARASTEVATIKGGAAIVGGTSKTELPNLYVLSIGVAEYPGDLKLNFAAQDAQAIEKVLRENGSALRTVKTNLVTDAQATRRGILAGLQWLKKEMTQRDVGVVFFSGHGMKDESGNFYLMPVDGDATDLASTALPGSQLRDLLASVPGKVVALLDACHAGAAGEEKRKSASLLTDDLVRELINDDVGVVVMCSSMGRESSLESNKHRQGYFTLALTSGLTGQADFDGDSIVDLKELDLYVTKEVKRLTDGRQHPVTKWPTTLFSPPITYTAARTAKAN